MCQLDTPTPAPGDPPGVCVSWCEPARWWWNLGSWSLPLWALDKDTWEVSGSSRSLSNTARTHPPPPVSWAVPVWEKGLFWVAEEGPRVWLWGAEEWFWIWFLVCFSPHPGLWWSYWSLRWKQVTSDNSTLSDTCRCNKPRSHQGNMVIREVYVMATVSRVVSHSI